mmetsp:Transcript_11873/g.13809  ORF Transcript_11873/g.13809 Transcript_11873/m.13809 type:complete len:406 (-) Transcript_11873:554-1771(-)|eukprot:CAMPEP_0184011414 /NCGR_PEP_ID=MMETSP0954-20121128/3815_1 /TAXON_ID=627963 /ORGANISM="Aplanochytrium sp, Strain PBS07" /LENGTH=405 /DNA_ID=CAMNT_0026291231 /DNA_START=213 /DNA_END=1430 /DNA_ORIENTATION=-
MATKREKKKGPRKLKDADNKSQEGFSGTFLDNQTPIIVCDCISYLREKGLFHEGVFRVPGSNDVVKRLLLDYDKHYKTPEMKATVKYDVLNRFPEPISADDVASLLKRYLAELNEPLIPQKSMHALVNIVKKLIDDEEAMVDAVSEVLSNIRSPNRQCLSFIISFLREVATFSFQNLMGGENLGKCMVPSLMRPSEKVDQIALLAFGSQAVMVMIMKPVRLHMPLLFSVLQNTKFNPQNLPDRANDTNHKMSKDNENSKSYPEMKHGQETQDTSDISRELANDLKLLQPNAKAKKRPSMLGLPKFSKIPSMPSMLKRDHGSGKDSGKNGNQRLNRKHVLIKPKEAFKEHPHVDSIKIDRKSAHRMLSIIKDNSVTNSPRPRKKLQTKPVKERQGSTDSIDLMFGI